MSKTRRNQENRTNCKELRIRWAMLEPDSLRWSNASILLKMPIVLEKSQIDSLTDPKNSKENEQKKTFRRETIDEPNLVNKTNLRFSVIIVEVDFAINST